MGCGASAGVMEQEAGFLSAMESAAAFGRQGGELQLLDHAGQIVVRGS
jgi:heat shock protein HslJ